MNRMDKSLHTRAIKLPRADRSLETFQLSEPKHFPDRQNAKLNRVAFAAAHVVADPNADNDPWLDCAIDWDRTIAFREHLWGLGLGVAEAMDTAQRGMGVDWPTSLELIKRSVAAAKACNGLVFSGCGTDQLDPGNARGIDDVIRAYEEQIEAIEAAGGRIVLMASRALARVARSPDDYAKVYGRVLQQRARAGDHPLARRHVRSGAGRLLGLGRRSTAPWTTAVEIINEHAAKVDGVKISLLDKDKEIAMRRRLRQGVLMYTGDDFNYAELIAGDSQGYSHALLGIFDAIAPAASAALVAACGQRQRPLPRHSRADRAAVAPHLPQPDPLLQDRRRVHGLSQRPSGSLHAWSAARRAHARPLHLADIFRLADKAGLLRDPDLAVARMRTVLAARGIEA